MEKRVILDTVDAVISVMGGQTKLAARLGISQPGIAKWKKKNSIPVTQVFPLVMALSSRGYLVSSKLFNIRGVTGALFAQAYRVGHESEVNATQFKHNDESNSALELDLFQQAAE